MDDHPDCVSTCTPLQNQLCYATWVTYTWVALLLRRPFLAIESCFVHLWRNQVVDHFKLKRSDGVFGWKFIKDFPSSHIHKWKRFGPGLFWCITVFFKLFNVCLCNVLVPCYYFFFNFRTIILVDRKCLLSGHNHLYITQGHIIIYFLLVPIRCLLVFKWMSTVRFSCFLFFFFNFHMFFFSPQTCVDSVGATIFTFPVVIQLNVFIAVPNHFVFWKSKIFFL